MIVAAAARAPDGFAVHGHHLTRDPTGPGLHPAGEAHLERVRVDQHEHPPEGVVGGDAIRQSQDGLQPGLLAPPIERDVLPALGAGDHRTDCDHEDVDELVIAPARLAGILQPCKARCQALDHAARPRLPQTGNGQHGPQSTARPNLMREPWHLLKDRANEGARVMFSMAMWMAAITAPIQIFIGDMHGLNTLEHQPAKVMAMEGHFESHPHGAPLILFGLPDQQAGVVRNAIAIPKASSLILKHSLNAPLAGLDSVPRENWPPVPIVFWSFRVMVGLGFLMAALGALSLFARYRGRLYEWPLLHRFAVVMGPSGIIAVLAGWVTTEVGRQPFTVYGALRTAESVSPLQAPAVASSLVAFVLVYFAVFGVGVWYILRLMHHAPHPGEPGIGAGPNRPIRTAGITPAPAVSPDRTLRPAE